MKFSGVQKFRNFMVMKVLERVVEGLSRQNVESDEMQYGFML